MAIPITIVDAFTEKAFAGNPAAVCVLDQDPDRKWMQLVAREMNLSETAFVIPRGDVWALRWFTPLVEVDLCGHATLATAHVLWEMGRVGHDLAIHFRTKSGELSAKREGGKLWLDFPALETEWADAPPMLADALGTHVVQVVKTSFDLLVELESEAAVRDLEPNLQRLAEVPARGVIVTAAATTPGFDFVSRFFAPRVGVPEDPVTGSAHCALTPYWGDRLGKTAMLAYQASERGGLVQVEWVGERVMLGGKAVTVVKGVLQV